MIIIFRVLVVSILFALVAAIGNIVSAVNYQNLNSAAASSITFYGSNLNWLGLDGSSYLWLHYQTFNGVTYINDYSKGASNIVAQNGSSITFGPTADIDYCDFGSLIQICSIDRLQCTNQIPCPASPIASSPSQSPVVSSQADANNSVGSDTNTTVAVVTGVILSVGVILFAAWLAVRFLRRKASVVATPRAMDQNSEFSY